MEDNSNKCGKLKNGGRGVYLWSLPRCQATAKHSGERCKNLACKGKNVCYLHGGRSTGPKNPHKKHGRYTKQNREARKKFRQAVRAMKQYYRPLPPVKVEVVRDPERGLIYRYPPGY